MFGVSVFLLFLVLGVVLLATELVVFQFSTFWLFFVGVGALCAAAWAALVPAAGLASSTAVFVLTSAALAAAFIQPLRRWQQQENGLEDNNALGQLVLISQAVAPDAPGAAKWSGSIWQAWLAPGQSQILQPGSYAKVVSVEGIRLFVTAIEERS